MKTGIKLIVIASIVISAVTGCATRPAKIDQAAEAASADARECSGPKKRVAVLRFGGIGKYGAYEGWDVGEAIAAQMSTALQQTNCLIVADRMALSEVLREQELGLAGVSSRESAPKAGGVLGAQVLIKGEITEFETGSKGNGMTVGLGLANIPLGLRLGGNRSKAHLAFDLRLIDATTGEIIATQRITSKANNFGLALGIDYRKGSIGTDHFSKTPLGKAVKKSAFEAAGFVVQNLQEVDWTGQVVDAQGPQVFLNAGADSGVEIGDTFTVSNVAKELVDPASGVVLGRIERKLGQIEVESVTDTYAVAKLIGDFPINRGDLLRQ